ncbi:MAG: hypothetical protein ACM3QS_08740 [Bacteroidota bacterium]
MVTKKWFQRPLFYVIMTAYFLLGYTTLGYGEKWAAILFPEDHYFENVGAISLFVASGLSFYIFIRAWKNRRAANIHWIKLLVYLGLAALYFFGGGEEISWGQRIFHFKEPASLAAENSQHEFNIHNLKIFEKSQLLKADNIFTVFWMVFAVLIPGVSLLWGRFKRFAGSLTPIVHWAIGLLFLFNYFFAKLAKSIYAGAYTYQVIPFPQAVQEVKESNYELLFVFLSLIVLWDLNRQLVKARQARESAPVPPEAPGTVPG